MLEMTQVVSAEGAALVEAQTGALFGDLKALQRQMQASIVLTPSLHVHLSVCTAFLMLDPSSTSSREVHQSATLTSWA